MHYSRTVTFLIFITSLLLPSFAHSANWSQEIVLEDYMKRYAFPEQLISYEIDFPGTFSQDHLRLHEDGKNIDYQLNETETGREGHLDFARVQFRTSLNKGQKRVFTLEHDPIYKASFQDRVKVIDIDEQTHTAALAANRLQIRVPFGEFIPNQPLSNLHPPIIHLSRERGEWIGKGRFLGGLQVNKIHARPLENGNLKMEYCVEYFIEGGRTYRVVLTLQHNESHITIDEYLSGFNEDDNAFFKFSYKDGVDPNGRLTVSNGGYNADRTGRWQYCGHYDRDIDDNGELPYQLGIWSPHSGPCVGATVFWNGGEKIDNAIIFSRYRTHEWKTPLRHLWNSGHAPENLYWYQTGNDKFMKTQLVGQQRHWAMALIKENEENPITIETQDGSKEFYWEANPDMEGLVNNKRTQRGAGPEVRLYQKLTEFKLDWVKDLTYNWDEKLETEIPEEFQDTEPVTYEDYVNNGFGIAGKSNWNFVEHYWGRHLGGATWLGRAQPRWLYEYAVSRKNWTPKQRQEVRSILIHWISSVTFRDGDQAHISMVSGHPNFLLETVFGGVYAAVFPNHPDAPKWKAAQERIFDECLKVYMRREDPKNNTIAGRWTESIACYSYASMRGLRHNIDGMKIYDGTDLLANRPRFKDWLRWHAYALVTAMDLPDSGYCYTPPQGAHTREAFDQHDGRKVGGKEWEFYGDLFGMAERMEHSAPELAEHLKYCLTQGKHGENPNYESALFRDYGAIMRYDFDGENEAYVNVQQIGAQQYRLPGYRNPPIHKSFNYRWSGRGNGIIYYAAKGKIWSWNGIEDNGDRFDIDKVSAFNIDGESLGFHPTDGVLYNFGPIQFYRANSSRDDYLNRDVMMVRDDYIAIFDNIRNETKGTFNWVNPIGSMPYIHKIKDGEGDNLHIVEASEYTNYQAAKMDFGAKLRNNGTNEYIIMNENDISIQTDELSFKGRSAYANKHQLAMFEGESLTYGDITIKRNGGSFGLNADIKNGNQIFGRIVGRKGGEVEITLPENFQINSMEVHCNGKRIPFEISNQTIAFQVEIGIQDFYKPYAIVPKGSPIKPAPQHPALTFAED